MKCLTCKKNEATKQELFCSDKCADDYDPYNSIIASLPATEYLKLSPGNIYTYHHEGHKVNFLLLLLSSDRIPIWEAGEDVWLCAQFMMGDGAIGGLYGAEIVLHTASEIRTWKEIINLSAAIPAEQMNTDKISVGPECEECKNRVGHKPGCSRSY